MNPKKIFAKLCFITDLLRAVEGFPIDLLQFLPKILYCFFDDLITNIYLFAQSSFDSNIRRSVC